MNPVSLPPPPSPQPLRRFRSLALFRGLHLPGLLAAALVLLAPAGAEAQAGQTTLAVWSGIPLPSEDLSQWVDSGFDLGVSLERRITDRIGIVFVGGRSHLDAVTFQPELQLGKKPGPSVVQWRYTLGLSLEVTDPAHPWEVSVDGGAGGGTNNVLRGRAKPGFYESLAGRSIRDADVTTNPALSGGIRVARDLEDFIGLPVGFLFQTRVGIIFNDAGDASEFGGRDSLFTLGFGLSYTL